MRRFALMITLLAAPWPCSRVGGQGGRLHFVGERDDMTEAGREF